MSRFLETVDAMLLQACEAAGGPNALCRALGVEHARVHSWRRVPALRVIAVEAITGIPRTVLRPDLYPTEGVPTPPVVWVKRVRSRPPGAAGNKYAGSYPRRKAAAALKASGAASSSPSAE